MNAVDVVNFDPLSQVHILVHGKAPDVGMSQEEVVRQTVEAVGLTGFGIDKGLAKMYLTAAIGMEAVTDPLFALSLCEAGELIFGVKVRSLQELQIALDYK